MKTEIKTNNAPAAIGPYSQAIEANGFVFASGQIPVNPATGEIPEGVEAQAEQVMQNMTNLLAAAGTSMENVVKTTVLLSDIANFVPMNEVYAQAFEGCEAYPARAAFAVRDLPKGVMVEIEVIAAK